MHLLQIFVPRVTKGGTGQLHRVPLAIESTSASLLKRGYPPDYSRLCILWEE